MAMQSMGQIFPKIYCYSTPHDVSHIGWVKIGYTTKNDVTDRIKEQTKTCGTAFNLEWQELAVYVNGESATFTDDDFKAFLIDKGVNNINHFGINGESIGDEWYEISAADARKYFDEFKSTPSIAKLFTGKYHLRNEQQNAIASTKAIVDSKSDNEVLWNAKPRFGKCLSAYDFCKQMNYKKILIVTNRPAVSNSWYSDYEKFFGREAGYFFVSSDSNIVSEKDVISYDTYANDQKRRENDTDAAPMGLIYFASLQDIKGSCYFGGNYNKLKELTTIHFDILLVDESHEGVATYKTEAAFNHINRDFTLYLSGTPFKAIADDRFDSDSIYNWTYVSEQEAKERWNGEGVNPYEQMPQLEMLTYRLSNIIGEAKADLTDHDDELELTGLNEFFRTVNGKFVHDSDVNKFLDVISSDDKYPFAPSNRDSINHTFWLLLRVDAVKELARKLREHPVFKDYEIIVAAGDGKADESDETGKSYTKVIDAVNKFNKTITLSVKQLTTGVTVPQWTGVMMLSERDSAAEYMQASFRPQNPYMFRKDNKMNGTVEYYRKEKAYVFDFNPEHTLDIVEQFANNLYSATANGKGDIDERKSNIDKLLKYMPVTGENDDGCMELLTSEKVIMIPRKLKSQEVVRRGFMCDALFQNITNVFRINENAIDIVSKLPIVNQPDKKAPALSVTEEEVKDMHLDNNGQVNVSDEFVKKETEKEVSTEEKQKTVQKAVDDVSKVNLDTKAKTSDKDKERKDFIDAFTKAAQSAVVDKMKEEHPDIVSKAVEKQIKHEIAKEAESRANALYSDYTIDTNTKEAEANELLDENSTPEDKKEVAAMISEAKEQAKTTFVDNAKTAVEDFINNNAYDIGVKTVIEAKANQAKNDKLDEFKKRLKGFARTIPSFLMAYGCIDFTLENLDYKIPNDVFLEVTSITLDEFKVLRDDCKYFDALVFNDAVQEFLKKREELADYFDETAKEDIFDYIPPQKTNQIYTPKAVVKQMADYLEQENPNCFDNPDKTFIDLYMKSGLYITEIVKRLYKSENMKSIYPDDKERLQHIFEKQVYGLAPTEIIYRIALRYILGFDDDKSIIGDNHNLRMHDALPDAQAGTLEKELDVLFKKGD